MDSIISTFHLDLKSLIAQAVNFGLIFLVLYKFAFKPIAKIMQERTKTIEKSLAEAKEIESQLKLTEANRLEVLAQAKKEALEIVKKANQTAEENRQQLVIKTKEELAEIVKQEKDNIQRDKEAAFKELKKDLGDLVVLATEKIIKEKIDGRQDQKIISEIIK